MCIILTDGTVSTAQLFITNHNIEDLLAPAGLQVFIDTLESVLGSPDPWIVSATAPTSIGVLTPPPPTTHGYVITRESFLAHSLAVSTS